MFFGGINPRKKGEKKMARGSSIHFENGNRHNFLHNDRTDPSKRDIFPEEKNYYSKPAFEALAEFDQLIKERQKIYEKRMGRKLHSKTIKHMSAIVNLDKHHTEEDLKKVIEYVEQSLDTKVVQFAIHRTEGHYDKQGKKVVNYHAHLEMLGLDSQGISIRRKMTKGYWMKSQTIVANILGMERGTKKVKRLGTQEFKRHAEEKKQLEIENDTLQNKVKEQEEKTKRITQKELKGVISELRKELQKMNGIREDYRLLEEEHRKLRTLIKNKEKNLQDISELKKELEEKLKKQIEEREQTRIETNQQIQKQVKRIIGKGDKSIIFNNTISFNIDELKKILTQSFKSFLGIKIVEKQLEEYQTLTKQQKQKIEVLTERLQQDGDVDSLKYEIKQLKRTINENLEDYNKIKMDYEKEIQQLKKQLPKKPSHEHNKDRDNDYKPTWTPSGPGLGR